jgi:hypothetical protein
MVDPLANAISKAAEAGYWDIVAKLAHELEARRADAAGVVRLVDERARRGR